MRVVAIHTEHAAADNFIVHPGREPIFFVALKADGR
jgi:hypothetical protein